MKKYSLVIYFFFFYSIVTQAQDLTALLDDVAGTDSIKAFQAYEKMLNADPNKLIIFFNDPKNREKLNENPNIEYSSPFYDLIPIARMAHYCREQNINFRSDSLRMYASSALGVLDAGSTPCAANTCAMSGLVNILTSSPCSFCITEAGVRLGAKMAYQVINS